MKKALKIAGNVLIWIFVLFAALITILAFSSQNSKSGVPSLFGKVPVSILTNSMAPTFNAGDLIISNQIKPNDKANLKAGDIITFFADLNNDGKAELNSHEIIEISQDGATVYYKTKGKANDLADENLVSSDAVVAKYTGVRIPALGKVFSFLKSSTGFLVCIVLPLIIFFLYELYRFIAIAMATKTKKLSEQEQEEIKRQAIEEYLNNQKAEQSEEQK